MSQAFFEHGLSRLDQVIAPDMICAFDFDGTLAPIVKVPDQVSVPAAVARRLERLAQQATVAIVTGRSVEDVRRYLDFAPHVIIGNHGIEGVPGWEFQGEHYRGVCWSWEQQLRPLLADRDRFDAGIGIENKEYSLSLHYRLARDPEQAQAALAGLIAGLTPPPHVIGGKKVFNLLPPGAPNKGTAMAQLLAASGASGAIYVGDDVTDEDVFALRRPDLLTVRVEPAPDTAAEFYLHHRLDMVQLLDALIERIAQARAQGERPTALRL